MYRPLPSIGSKSCLWVVGWMYQVDVYLRVCRAVMVDGMSIREVSRVFGLHRDTVRKILAYSARIASPKSLLYESGCLS